MLKSKTIKLEPHSQVCLFLGYPKETMGGFFFSSEENKVFVSTNITFLEEDYMREFKPCNKIVLEELLASSTSLPSTTVVDKNITHTTSERQMTVYQNDLPPRYTGRIVRQFDRYLGILRDISCHKMIH